MSLTTPPTHPPTHTPIHPPQIEDKFFYIHMKLLFQTSCSAVQVHVQADITHSNAHKPFSCLMYAVSGNIGFDPMFEHVCEGRQRNPWVPATSKTNRGDGVHNAHPTTLPPHTLNPQFQHSPKKVKRRTRDETCHDETSDVIGPSAHKITYIITNHICGSAKR